MSEPEVVVLLDELVHASLVLGLGVAHALVQRGLAALELLALQPQMHRSEIYLYKLQCVARITT